MRVLAVILLTLLLSACAPQKYAVNQSFLNSNTAQKSKNILLLPANINVMEVSAGGVAEKVDVWSDQAKANMKRSLLKIAKTDRNFQFLELPEMSVSDKDAIDKHLGLYELIGGDAFIFGRSNDSVWQHKKNNFDYTVGDGLSFLRQKTGADAALFVVGSDQISTGGRKAVMLLGAMVGVVIPAGMTFVSAGLVDLQTGNILWLNYDIGGGNWDVRNPEDTDQIVANIFKDYPVAQ